MPEPRAGVAAAGAAAAVAGAAVVAAGAVVAVAGLAAAAGATGAGWAGALEPMLAGRTDLVLPMRLAWASEGKVSDAIAMAITEAVARYEVFTEFVQSWLS